MKALTIPGVPLAMQQDGWWLDAPADKTEKRRKTRRADGGKALLLLALIALGDVLVWDTVAGLNIAVFFGAVLFAGLGVAWPRLSARTRVGIVAGVVLSLLPLVELVQPLSLLIALVGLSLCTAALAGVSRFDLLRGAARLWWVAPAQTFQDGVLGARQLNDLNFSRVDMRSLVMTWGVPAGTSLVFALLILAANPVLDSWVSGITALELPAPDWWRVWFWLFLAAAIWPALVTWRMRERLRAREPRRATVRREGVINAGSVARSLIAFNALFAVQTGMDVLFLYGDAGLPDGISPAAYAHRGAYPLLVTALFAGLFAVVARPYLAGRPVLRWLMLIWLAQTMALVVASVWRLDIYVDAFGLTRLRLAAYIWMGLVAAGLGIVVWQIWRDKPAAWMMLRSGVMGAVVLYLCTFVSFDAAVARHNLSHPVHQDMFMLCQLSEDVIPALASTFGHNWQAACVSEYMQPHLFQPDDWREWGFRNWRTRNSLASMLTDPAIP
ncbi:hypothetical protein GCM10007385_06230 [Tateyamaria omphalii]|uniref:DUF4153 domain-containing protein n=1 Tax=Tateyamaria omphalii TaxID=299262 RepID=UPI00167AFECB|nr:DUF4173 domain-containing protein [Tateyamaria omphalii]GGX41435.1 hypothetical protein GCM10007385_06230 [Tateyamaria omphalii]